MSSPINVVRWQNKLRAMLGVRGENPVPSVAELVPVIVVEEDRPEWGYAGQERRFATANLSQGGFGGEFGYIVLINPVGTGIVATVECVCNTTSFQGAILKLGALDPVTEAEFVARATVTAGLDSREHDGTTMPNSALVTSVGTIAGALPRNPHYFLGLGAANQPAPSSYTDFGYRAILAPGSWLAIEGAVVATAISGWFRYRERAQERGKPS